MTTRTLTGNRCQCPTCADWFNSTSTFDRHRVGSFESAGVANTRHCLAEAEMTARGWSRNAAGFWIERRREAATISAQGPRVAPPASGVASCTSSLDYGR